MLDERLELGILKQTLKDKQMFPHPNHCPEYLREPMKVLMADEKIGGGFGFIVTRFGTTAEHQKVFQFLENVESRLEIPLVRADYATFAPDLWANVQCFMHGCRFAIAVFEDAEGKGYNPNVALETGYLLAIEKPTIILKSASLSAMPSDLLSKLYIPYDTSTDLSVPLTHTLDWIARKTSKLDDLLNLPLDEDTLGRLLAEVYPSIKSSQPGDRDHITRHMGGLRRFGYSNIAEVMQLLEVTENARRFVSRYTLPEFAVCSISHSIALVHPEYLNEGFWKPNTVDRITEAARHFEADWK